MQLRPSTRSRGPRHNALMGRDRQLNFGAARIRSCSNHRTDSSGSDTRLNGRHHVRCFSSEVKSGWGGDMGLSSEPELAECYINKRRQGGSCRSRNVSAHTRMEARHWQPVSTNGNKSNWVAHGVDSLPPCYHTAMMSRGNHTRTSSSKSRSVWHSRNVSGASGQSYVSRSGSSGYSHKQHYRSNIGHHHENHISNNSEGEYNYMDGSSPNHSREHSYSMRSYSHSRSRSGGHSPPQQQMGRSVSFSGSEGLSSRGYAEETTTQPRGFNLNRFRGQVVIPPLPLSNIRREDSLWDNRYDKYKLSRSNPSSNDGYRNSDPSVLSYSQFVSPNHSRGCSGNVTRSTSRERSDNTNYKNKNKKNNYNHNNEGNRNIWSSSHSSPNTRVPSRSDAAFNSPPNSDNNSDNNKHFQRLPFPPRYRKYDATERRKAVSSRSPDVQRSNTSDGIRSVNINSLTSIFRGMLPRSWSIKASPRDSSPNKHNETSKHLPHRFGTISYSIPHHQPMHPTGQTTREASHISSLWKPRPNNNIDNNNNSLLRDHAPRNVVPLLRTQASDIPPHHPVSLSNGFNLRDGSPPPASTQRNLLQSWAMRNAEHLARNPVRLKLNESHKLETDQGPSPEDQTTTRKHQRIRSAVNHDRPQTQRPFTGSIKPIDIEKINKNKNNLNDNDNISAQVCDVFCCGGSQLPQSAIPFSSWDFNFLPSSFRKLNANFDTKVRHRREQSTTVCG